MGIERGKVNDYRQGELAGGRDLLNGKRIGKPYDVKGYGNLLARWTGWGPHRRSLILLPSAPVIFALNTSAPPMGVKCICCVPLEVNRLSNSP